MLYEVITIAILAVAAVTAFSDNVQLFSIKNDYTPQPSATQYITPTAYVTPEPTLEPTSTPDPGPEYRITSYNVCYTKLLRN